MGVGQTENKGKEMEENQSGARGIVSLVEKCFVAENTVDERRIMINLEKTMQAALIFAGGGDEPENSLWIIRILLGRMIRERTKIGKDIKALAKFQRREVM